MRILSQIRRKDEATVISREKMEKQRRRQQHVVAFPLPWQGHINPLFQFLRRIAEAGIVVTIVNTEARYAELVKTNGGQDPFVSAGKSLGLDIRSRTVSDGLPPDLDRYVYRDLLWDSMRTSMVPHVEDLMTQLMKETPPVSCLLTDCFAWPSHIARKFKLPHANFCTQAACVFSLFKDYVSLLQNGVLPFPETADCNEKSLCCFAGLPPMRIADVHSFLQEADPVPSNPFHNMIVETLASLEKADWILANTVEELEDPIISALRQSGTLILPIGPLLPEEFMDRLDSVSSQKTNFSCRASLLPELDLSAWLNSKPRDSVVYISFGSFSRCNIELLEEFAMGLLNSKQSFIWVLRPDVLSDCSAVEEILPREFMGGIKEQQQGLLVNWCSQLDVLQHSSVGTFVTHCGWNSVLEGLWIGVPMMTFPLAVDQYPNSWLLTDKLGVAVSLGRVACRSRGHSRAAVPRDEIENCLRDFMTDARQRRQAKDKAEWGKEVVRKAVLDANGSSARNLELFLEALSAEMESDEVA